MKRKSFLKNLLGLGIGAVAGKLLLDEGPHVIVRQDNTDRIKDVHIADKDQFEYIQSSGVCFMNIKCSG